jgi:O-antigen/teichoic acid export membrane protein
MVFTIIMTPFWSAFTDAYTKKDFNWIRNVILKMQKYWFLLVVTTVCLLMISPLVFNWWLGDRVKIPFTLSVAMAIYVIAYAWQTIHVFLLNGIGVIKLQLYVVLISAIINIPLAFFLGGKIGLAGITLSNAVLFIAMGIVFSIQCKKILNKTATNIWIQ